MDRFKISFTIASTFFAIGTILFAIQAIFREINTITFLGFYFVSFAIIFNVFVFIGLLIVLILDSNKKHTLKSIGAIVLNIPIAFLYYFLVANFLI